MKFVPKVDQTHVLFEHSAEDKFWHGLIPICTIFPPHQQLLYYGLHDRGYKAEMEQAAALTLRVFPEGRLSVPATKLRRAPLREDREVQPGDTAPLNNRRVKVGFISSQVWDTSEMRHFGGMLKRLSSSKLEVVVIHTGDLVIITPYHTLITSDMYPRLSTQA